MAVTSKADVEYFKLPKDFASLHNLKDLIQYRQTTLEIEKNLKQYEKNLIKYTETYFTSYTMNIDEVLLYVEDIEQYRVCLHGNDIALCTKQNWKHKGGDGKPYTHRYKSIECLQNVIKLYKKYIDKNHKLFLVDTVNKKVEICYWLIPQPEPKKITKKEYLEKSGSFFEYEGYDDSKIMFNQREADSDEDILDPSYTGSSFYPHGYTYKVKSIKGKNILEVTADFYREYSAYESKSNGFGGRMTTRSAHGKDTHHFCMDTNKYLGFQSKLSSYGEEDKSKGIYYGRD